MDLELDRVTTDLEIAKRAIRKDGPVEAWVTDQDEARKKGGEEERFLHFLYRPGRVPGGSGGASRVLLVQRPHHAGARPGNGLVLA